MFCQNCGEENLDSANFCRDCGGRFPEISDQVIQDESRPLVLIGNEIHIPPEVKEPAEKPSALELASRLTPASAKYNRIYTGLSCLKCHNRNTVSKRGCLIWFLVIFFFPLGLLFLLIPTRNTCNECGFVWK